MLLMKSKLTLEAYEHDALTFIIIYIVHDDNDDIIIGPIIICVYEYYGFVWFCISPPDSQFDALKTFCFSQQVTTRH